MGLLQLEIKTCLPIMCLIFYINEMYCEIGKPYFMAEIPLVQDIPLLCRIYKYKLSPFSLPITFHVSFYFSFKLFTVQDFVGVSALLMLCRICVRYKNLKRWTWYLASPTCIDTCLVRWRVLVSDIC